MDHERAATPIAGGNGPAVGRDNAFGFLRLAMAVAVIVSHAAVLRNGNAGREPFLALFHSITLGEVAVDGFFAISGFLVAGSFLNTGDARAYLLKRIARLYPAFLLASLVCMFVVAPLGGADLRAMRMLDWLGATRHLVLLAEPTTPSFHGLPLASLDRSMWTLAYELRCYLLLVILGRLGLLQRPWALMGITMALLLLRTVAPAPLASLDAMPFRTIWLGDVHSATRLYALFLAGSAFRAFGVRIRYTRAGLAIAAALLVVALSIKPLATLGFALFGTYLVLGVAFLGRDTVLARINNRVDISYGVYLYAWPITVLLLWYWRTIPLGPLIALTFAGACVCGWGSWHGIEKPALEWARQRAGRWTRPVCGGKTASQARPAS